MPNNVPTAAPGLPGTSHKAQRHRMRGLLTEKEHGELLDALTLSADIIEAGDIDRMALMHLVRHLRVSLRIAHKHWQGGAA
ncbi:hypothetical protein [Frigidibacter sp. MR17.24]|uniref:hypothetical protein n=1 Tax=Frigidibacter sp. MR17.24 TaxID=3127345 RepID=UPI0030130959